MQLSKVERTAVRYARAAADAATPTPTTNRLFMDRSLRSLVAQQTSDTFPCCASGLRYPGSCDRCTR